MKPEKQLETGAGDSPVSTDQAKVLDFNIIPVTLTFEGFLPFQFEFKRQSSQDVKDERQAFYAMTDEEQAAQLSAYRLKILSKQLSSRPLNVVGMQETEDFRADFEAFCLGNEEILQWIWSAYQGKLYPKELLSSVLE